MKPTLYIIAGCNGAGKTTASYAVLPKLLDCHEFVNADEIAKGLSPFNPESVALEAGKLMIQRIEQLLRQGKTFAIETTLATRSYASLVNRAHERGYNVVLLFFWLPSPEMAEARVAKRVNEGGHNIPVETIHRRYWAGSKNPKIMSEKDKIDLRSKINEGLKQSYESLLRRKAALGQDMVIADNNGQPMIVPAAELLANKGQI